MFRKCFLFLRSKKGIGIWLPTFLGLISLFFIPFFPYLRFTLCLFPCICLYWILFYGAYLLRNHGRFRIISRIYLGISGFLAANVLVLFVVIQCCIFSDREGDNPSDPPNFLIVLGCQVVGENPSAMLEERLLAALSWMKIYPDSKAVLSGFHGSNGNLSEAEAMKKWLTEHGIEEDRLILDEKSRNTEENIVNSLSLLREIDPELGQVFVVSNGFHLFRAKKLCEWENCRAYGLAGEMPGSPIFAMNWYLREFASVSYMYAKRIFA